MRPDLPDGDPPGRYPPYLRLVWSNPDPGPRRPAGPVDLARAIERHLAGDYGLSDAEFLELFGRGVASAGSFGL